MDIDAVTDLVAYAAELDPDIGTDDLTVEVWADQLRGIVADRAGARAAVRRVAEREPLTPARVREALLPLDPDADRRWGTAMVVHNPNESDEERHRRRRRGLEKIRWALAREPLPIDDDTNGVTE